MGKKRLITLRDPTSFETESYKLLRTNLNFRNKNQQLKVLLITSAGKEEGKTTSICNLAVTFAQEGKRVLLLDADLRQPQVHSFFGISKDAPGMTNLLVDALDYGAVVNKIENLNKLDVLTAGDKKVSPTELLDSNLFINLILGCRQVYEWILIDTPPVLSFADTNIVAKVTDGTLLVVAAEETKKKFLTEAQKSLEKVGAEIVGVIMTKVKIDKSADYYQYNKKTKD